MRGYEMYTEVHSSRCHSSAHAQLNNKCYFYNASVVLGKLQLGCAMGEMNQTPKNNVSR